MSKTTIAILSLGLLFGACSSEPKSSPVLPDAASDAMVAGAEMHRHDAMCGCSIEGIGSCGNYIKVDGEFVPLVYPELGVMEFCKDKKNGAVIEVAGTMVDGKFVASSYQRVN